VEARPAESAGTAGLKEVLVELVVQDMAESSAGAVGQTQAWASGFDR